MAVVLDYKRFKLPPTKCNKCTRGYVELPDQETPPFRHSPQMAPCDTCGATGWDTLAVWFCRIHTPLNVCNPDRKGGGHQDCGWALPLALFEVSV